MKHETTIDLLFDLAEKDQCFIGIYSKKQELEKLSYLHIKEKSQVYAQLLLSSGVKFGDNVALILPTRKEWIYAFFGAQLVGAIPFSLYPPSGFHAIGSWLETTDQLLSSSDTKIVVTQGYLKKRLDDQLAQSKREIRVLDIEDSDQFKHLEVKYEFSSPRVNRTCFMQFSSGTTSSPKLAMISHSNVMNNLEAIEKGLEFNGEKIRCVSWLPLYHDMGLVGAFLGAMQTRADLYLIRPEHFLRRPIIWPQIMSEVKANVTVAPNFAYGLVTNRAHDDEISQLDLSHLRVALCGAETIQKRTIDKFLNKFEKSRIPKTSITPVYGLCEATLAATFSPIGEEIKWKKIKHSSLIDQEIVIDMTSEGIPICSVGEPVLNTSIEVKSSRGEKLPEDEVGEVYIKGPGVMNGYYKQKTRDKDLMLATGDLGFLSEGLLYICGRIKETIIVNGKNFNSALIEDELLGIDGLRDGKTILTSIIDNTIDTEKLFVFAERNKIGECFKNWDETKLEIQSRLSKFNLSHSQFVVLSSGQMPQTSSGKIQRAKLTKMWKAGELEIETQKKREHVELAKYTIFSLKNSFKKMRSWFSS